MRGDEGKEDKECREHPVMEKDKMESGHHQVAGHHVRSCYELSAALRPPQRR